MLLTFAAVKKIAVIFSLVFILNSITFIAKSQCAMCTKTAMQMGEKPAQGLNSGILYLMLAPFTIVGFIGYKWWKNNKAVEASEQNTVDYIK